MRKKIANGDSLKTHKRDFYINKVFVGQSKTYVLHVLLATYLFFFFADRIPISRTNEGFVCPTCNKRLASTRRFKDHLKQHDLSLDFTVKNVRSTLDEENKNKDDTPSDMEEYYDEQLDALSQLLPPPPLVIDDASVQRKKRKTLSFTETILAASDAIATDNQSQQDKIKLAQVGR